MLTLSTTSPVAPFVGLNFALPNSAAGAGSIAGTITDFGTGQPVSGVCVNATTVGSGPSASATTNAVGAYTINGLPIDGYIVSVDPTCGGQSTSTYSPETYPVNPVSVSASTMNVTDVNFGLWSTNAPGPGTISGTITDNFTGAAIGGACVSAANMLSGPINQEDTSVNGGATVTANSDGSYSIGGLADGTYAITVDPTCGGTNSSPYGAMSFTAGIEISSAQENYTGQDFQLQTLVPTGTTYTPGPGSISGVVSDFGTAQGIGSVCVIAAPFNSPTVHGGARSVTASDGSYTISGLAAGTYVLTMDPTCGGQSSSAYGVEIMTQLRIKVSSNPGPAIANVAMQTFLAPGPGSISGTVTDASTTSGVNGVCVSASLILGPNGYVQGNSSPALTAQTDSNGNYSITGLNFGLYSLTVDPSCGGNNPSTYAAQPDLNALTVWTTQPNVTGQDFALSAGVAISGTVEDATSNAGLGDICVSAAPQPYGPQITTTTAEDGSYTLNDLAQGVTYDLIADPTCLGKNSSNYASETLANVTITAPMAPENFTLVSGGSISGEVINGVTQEGVPNACVTAFPTSLGTPTEIGTNFDGSYSFSGISLLAPGSYTVSVDPSCSFGQPSPYTTLQSVVVVTAGANTVVPTFALGQLTITQPGTTVEQPLFSDNANTGSITFQTVTVSGTTQVTPLTSGDNGYVPASGFSLGTSLTQYFDISTTATFTGEVTVCVPYSTAEFPSGTTPSLMHYSDGQWQNVTTSVDTVNQIVCGEVSSFSPLTLGVVASVSISNMPSSAVAGTSFTPQVTTNSDGTTSVTSGTPSVCTVDPSTGIVSFIGGGECTLKAHVTAGSVLAAADGADQSVTVALAFQAPLSITNTALSTPANKSITLTTSGGSGVGALSFAVSGQGCSVSASSPFVLSTTVAGSCVVSATKAANGIYGATTSAPVTFTFTPVAQAPLHLVGTPATAVHGHAITLSTSGGSGSGEVSYLVVGAWCSLKVNVLSASRATTCSVVAFKAGSGIYAGAISAWVAFRFT